MALRILSNSNVNNLLVNFTASDIQRMSKTLLQAFYAYSVEGEHENQPHRAAVTRPDGQTMLFMPATLSDGVSVKIVGVPAPSAPGAPPLRGALVLCDASGKCIGLMNSEEFTAFRTSLGSILLYQYRKATKNIVVFGAGKQALWHLRLAFVLRGNDTSSVTIVNRSAKRAEQLIEQLRQMDAESSTETTAKIKFTIIHNETNAQYESQLRAALEASDVIFCTTPSKEPLFPAEWLVSKPAGAKARYISAIGSYKLDMAEIDPDYLRYVTKSGTGPLNTADSGSIVVVDSRAACKLEAGELVKAELRDDQMLEMGEIVERRKAASEVEKQTLETWFQEGLVVYKSVGVGVMDLALGRGLLDIASEKNIGQSVAEF
ncbi:hypothetical protein HJFPF1_10951 [Paramyrothecium foliicola]|nr:hypothetical protein HJFPF1_10951 [Paramyrothecium foliicola]